MEGTKVSEQPDVAELLTPLEHSWATISKYEITGAPNKDANKGHVECIRLSYSQTILLYCLNYSCLASVKAAEQISL